MSDEIDDGKPREGASYAHRERANLPGHDENARTEQLTLRQQFDAARRNGANALLRDARAQERAAWERVRRIHQRPVSKVERDALKRSLAMPRAELNLEPHNAVRFRIEQRVTIESVRRIEVIDRSLNRLDGLARRDFNRSR